MHCYDVVHTLTLKYVKKVKGAADKKGPKTAHVNVA